MSEFTHIKNFLPEDSLDYQRLVAFHQKATTLGYAQGHLWMACIAAFPAFLTPDLLYKLWLNFRQLNRKDGQKVIIDRMAVSDVLLSDLMEEIAVEVYAMRQPVRTALLAFIDHEISSQKVDQDLMKRLADFVLRYVRSYQMEGESVTTAIREAQEWNALAYFNPTAAVNELKKALSQAAEQSAHQKLLRISLLLKQIDDQQVALNRTEQRSQFRTLVDYSQGMQAFIRGNQQEAVDKFKSLPNSEQTKVTTESKSIHLPIPKQIYKAIAAENEQSAQQPRQLFATLVGIDIHQDSAKLPDLTGAVNDADNWREYLLERFSEKPQIHLLQNGAATKQAVLDVLERQFKQAQAGDHIFFFFAGHGQNQADGQAFNTIILHDYDAANPTQGLIAENEFRLLTDSSIPAGVSFTLLLDTHAGSTAWLDTHHPDGRYIYSACTNTQRSMESEGSGIFSASLLHQLNEWGELPISHQELLGRTRKEMMVRNANPSQTAVWFGPSEGEGKAFLSENSWPNLRLRERLLENGLISTIAEKEIEKALTDFGKEWSIPSDLSLEKALTHRSLVGKDKELRVFVSRANNQLPIAIYEDVLKRRDIPYSLYVHEVEHEGTKGSKIEQEEGWPTELQAAHLVILQLDNSWINASESTTLSREIQILRMVSDVPTLLLYVENCNWQTRLVGQLGTPWPAEPLLNQYKGSNDPALIEAFDDYLSGHLSYFKPFFGDASLQFDLSVYQSGLLEQLLEMAGRFHPKEVAYLDSRSASREQKVEFIGANFPIPLGNAIERLFELPKRNEELAPVLDCYSISISYLNILLLGVLEQIVDRSEEGVHVLSSLRLDQKLQQANWLTFPKTSREILQLLTELPSIAFLVEEIQPQLESLIRLSKTLTFPTLIDNFQSPSNPKAEFTLQQVINQNYQALSWLTQLECLIDQDLSKLAQLYNLRDHTPFLFKDASFNPFETTDDQYLFVQYEPSTQVITYESIEGGKTLEIGPENRPYIPLWESFQAYWASVAPAIKPNVGPPQKVHALLVGIDQYPRPLPSLQAPKADTERLKAYLERQPVPALTENLSGAVTKATIVDTLTKVIEGAETGDAVIFYFSGLGQKEQSPNPENTIPALLCYDQQRMTIDEVVYLLCRDKEKALHPIIILDTGTSDLETKDTAGEGLRPKGVSTVAPRREWEDYVFAPYIPNMEAWEAFMTEATFVLMVACDYESETAYEKGDSSLFTENLIQVLTRSRHAVSYPLLQERLAVFLENQVQQLPDIDVKGQENQLHSHNFLGQPAIDFQPIYGKVEWNRRLQKWTLDMGSLLGVKADNLVHICRENYEGNQLAHLSYVYPSYSVLAFGDVVPNRKESFLAYIDDSLGYEPLALAVQLDQEDSAKTLSLLNNEFPAVNFQAQPEAADFILSQDEQGFSVTEARQEDRSMHRLPPMESSEASKALTAVLRKMTHWKAIRSIKNLAITVDPFADSGLKVEFFTLNGKEKIAHPLVGKEVEIPFSSTGDGQTLSEKLQLQVTNLSDRSQYFTLVYLPLDFTVVTNLLTPPIIPIKAGETFADIEWELSLTEMVIKENWPTSRFYIKVLASDQPFDLSLWQQNGLDQDGQAVANEQKELDPIQIKHDHFWIVDTITIIQPNPFFKENIPLNKEELKQLLAEEKVEVFITQLLPILPIDSNAFRDLINAGSRYYHNKYCRINNLASEEEHEIYELRVYQNLLRLLTNPEVETALNGDAPSTSIEANSIRFLYELLLKQGSTKALDQIPTYFEQVLPKEKERQALRQSDFEIHLNFGQSLQTYEEYMVAYSRQLLVIRNWINDIDATRMHVKDGVPTPVETKPLDVGIDDWPNKRERILDQIKANELLASTQLLLEAFPNHKPTKEVHLFQVKYQIATRQLNQGVIDREDFAQAVDLIRFGLIYLLESIAPLQLHQPSFPSKTEWQQQFIKQITAGGITEVVEALRSAPVGEDVINKQLILVDQRLKTIEKQSTQGIIKQDRFLSEQLNIAKELLAIIDQLPTPIKNNEPPSSILIEVPETHLDRNLLINRQAQVDAFRSYLDSKKRDTQFFLIPCPPKSEPQHMLKRLGWELQQREEDEVIVLETIHIDVEISTRKLNDQLEKATAQRFASIDSKKMNTIFFPVHIEGDWDSNREVLLNWVKTQAEKLFSNQWAKSQLIVPIAIDLPAKNQGSISKLFRGDRFEDRLKWLETIVGRFPLLVLLPTLEKIQWPDLDEWLQQHFRGKSAEVEEEEIRVIKDFIARGELDLAFDKLDNEELYSEEELSQLIILKSKFAEITQANRMSLITSTYYQQESNKIMLNLLNFLDTLVATPSNIDDPTLTQILQEGLGTSPDGYHMEEVLNVVNSDSFKSSHDTIAIDNKEVEEALWNRALYYGDQATYSKYLTAFPTGIHADLARQALNRLENVQLSHQAEPLPRSPSSSTSAQELTHRIQISIAAEEAEITQIESVTYYLHKSFKNNVITVDTAATNFSLSIQVWGTFDVKADVKFKDGVVIKLERYLDIPE